MFKKISPLILILLILPLSAPQATLGRDFFVNPENGQPRVKIVYGQYAAQEDYENALNIAQAISNYLCYVISEEPQYLWPEWKEGTAPDNVEVVLTPEAYGYLWYTGKTRIYGNVGYDETKAHEEIRFKVDLKNKVILYVKYIVTNIKHGDDIQFLGKMYHVNTIEEDRVSCEEEDIISSTGSPYWYNTLWYLKVYSDRIELYMENIPMRTNTPVTTPTITLENGDKWLVNIIVKWKTDTEFEYTVQCGEAYELEQTERTKIPIGVDPYTMLIRDTEITREMKQEYNLILVGGPGLVLQPTGEKRTANEITEELILNGYSKVNWYVSLGKFEYIERAFSDKGVIIVAGKDRESTTVATELLIDKIKEIG